MWVSVILLIGIAILLNHWPRPSKRVYLSFHAVLLFHSYFYFGSLFIIFPFQFLLWDIRNLDKKIYFLFNLWCCYSRCLCVCKTCREVQCVSCAYSNRIVWIRSQFEVKITKLLFSLLCTHLFFFCSVKGSYIMIFLGLITHLILIFVLKTLSPYISILF